MFGDPRLLLISVAIIGGGLQWYWKSKNRSRSRSIHKNLNYYGDKVANNLLIFVCLLYIIYPRIINFANWQTATLIITLGCVISYVSLGLWAWSQFAMGPNWSEEPTIWSDQELIVSGPYRFIRHPMYLAFILLAIGITLATHNWLIAIIISVHTLLVVGRAPSEEKILLNHFGSKYKSYISQTPRYIPRLIFRKKPFNYK